jgi:hypothetical protein
VNLPLKKCNAGKRSRPHMADGCKKTVLIS